MLLSAANYAHLFLVDVVSLFALLDFSRDVLIITLLEYKYSCLMLPILNRFIFFVYDRSGGVFT